MSFKWSDIRWGRVILGTVLAFIIAAGGSMLVQVFYGLVRGFQLRGAPPREVLVAFAISLTNLVIGLVLTALGALIGGRVAARRVEAGCLPSRVVRLGFFYVALAFKPTNPAAGGIGRAKRD